MYSIFLFSAGFGHHSLYSAPERTDRVHCVSTSLLACEQGNGMQRGVGNGNTWHKGVDALHLMLYKHCQT